MLTLFKLLSVCWPFFKEVVFENSEIRAVILRNKLTTAFVVINTLLFVLFMYAYTEARNKENTAFQYSTQISHLEQRNKDDKAYFDGRLSQQEEFWKKRLDDKSGTSEADQLRIKGLEERISSLTAERDTWRNQAGNYKQQLDLIKRADNAKSPAAKASYLDRLERLRQASTPPHTTGS
jgi:hypothetical protein